MKMPLQLAKKDLMLLKNAAMFFVVLPTLAVVMLIGARSLQQAANESLDAASMRFEQARSSLTQISEEEETIGRFIDRYLQMEADGIVSPLDRLQFLERVRHIRESLQLYTIDVSMDEQNSLLLTYPPDDLLPGEPVALNQTTIDLTLSLLHEGDLLRLFDQLLISPGLLQPSECMIEMVPTAENAMTQFRENLKAQCKLHWYSFDLTPPAAIAEDGA
jgi:hypothetical protein